MPDETRLQASLYEAEYAIGASVGAGVAAVALYRLFAGVLQQIGNLQLHVVLGAAGVGHGGP